jgi:hypothetical protein
MVEVTMSYGNADASKSMQCRLAVAIGFVVLLAVAVTSVQSGEGTEFPGTVVSVDLAAGKFAVKKDGGGTRFTFVTDDKTAYSGMGLTSVKDLKKDDHVLVTYQVKGTKYVATSVAKK